MELLTAAQMRAIEQAAIDSGQVTGLELMERAGRGVVEAILEWRPEFAEGKHSAVILCGPGNNGGDGFVVARLLKGRGWNVTVYLLGEISKLPPDAKENAERWNAHEKIKPFASITSTDNAGNSPALNAELVIDALFGTGLSRPLNTSITTDITKRIVLQSREEPARSVVAIDCPSGLCLDSGRLLSEFSTFNAKGYVLRADLTVTFHGLKRGHILGDGPYLCGKLVCADIGIRPRYGGDVHVIGNPVLELATPSYKTHKYEHGHALILSGGMGRTGAARLAARGALRIGAGVVTVASPPSAVMENATHLTAIMLRKIRGAEGLTDILADGRINALCLGPGLGVDGETRALVKVACSANRAVTLDAGALTSFADDPAALFAILNGRCVLTPHEGEFGRLFPDILEKLHVPATTGPAYSKVDATREAAARAGCVVLFKGADTVIADPSGSCAINTAHYERSAPWLATAGSGDVLAGFVTGLMARHLSPFSAAKSAAWLHVECARHIGPGLIAEDIPEALPAVLKQVLGWKPPSSA